MMIVAGCCHSTQRLGFSKEATHVQVGWKALDENEGQAFLHARVEYTRVT